MSMSGAPPSKTLFIGGIGDDFTLEDLKAIFGRYAGFLEGPSRLRQDHLNKSFFFFFFFFFSLFPSFLNNPSFFFFCFIYIDKWVLRNSQTKTMPVWPLRMLME